MNGNSAYRPDIEGLRALAVLAVVGYHAIPSFTGGGFIGVDVFFVISGFLISRIIIEDLAQNKFSFGEFYARRIRRLFPALILVVTTVLFVGWYMQFPEEFRQLGKHGAAGIGFIDNFILWSETGYFDETANKKPFLHLWSLGVEEQFYLIWPLILFLCFKFKKNPSFVLLACLILSLSADFYQEKSDAEAGFYLPFARFWEFMAGAAIAVLPVPGIRPKVSAFLSVIGFGLILGSAFLLKDKSDFGGVYALWPVSGTALLICAGANAWLNRVILSIRPMIVIGQISYPLYLWHWPILSYLHILKLDHSMAATTTAVMAAFGLAWLTFRYVEMSFRQKPAPRYAVPLLGEAALIVTIGIIIYAGFLPPRLNYRELNLVLAARDDWAYPPPGTAPQFFDDVPVYKLKGQNRDEVLYLGDSNMEQYAPRIAEIIRTSDNTYSATFMTMGGCRPIPNIANEANPKCLKLMPAAMKYINTHKVRRVVIAGLWSSGLFGDTLYYHFPDNTKRPLSDEKARQAAIDDLAAFITTLKRKNIDVILVQSIPANASKENMLAINRLNLLVKANTVDALALSHPKVWRKLAVDQKSRILIYSIAQKTHADIINPVSHLCGSELCNTLYNDNQYIYKDENHLAANYVAKHAAFIDQTIFFVDDGM